VGTLGTLFVLFKFMAEIKLINIVNWAAEKGLSRCDLQKLLKDRKITISTLNKKQFANKDDLDAVLSAFHTVTKKEDSNSPAEKKKKKMTVASQCTN
jgi:hypothetical protein